MAPDRLIGIDHVRRALSLPGAPSSDFDLNPGTVPKGLVLKDAGVLVPLIDGSRGLEVILTKRSARLRHHPGQVAFPGGRKDDTDASVTDAALREAEEEIGLPRSLVDPIGSLPAHQTVTGYAVTPVIGHVRSTFDVRPEPGEVAEVFRVPFGFLMTPANYQVEGRIWQGRKRLFYTVPFGPYYIWGATARMLRGLADRVQQCD